MLNNVLNNVLRDADIRTIRDINITDNVVTVSVLSGHGEFLTLGEAKMAKSAGNIIRVASNQTDDGDGPIDLGAEPMAGYRRHFVAAISDDLAMVALGTRCGPALQPRCCRCAPW